MQQNEPLISVIITTFNRKTLLKKAIESVINQTYKNLEIIIADNHSTDGTEDLCNEFTKKDARIKYFRHKKNLGMTINTNFAHTKTTGEYLHVLCDDDWLDLDFIEICYNEFKKHPNYSFISPTVWLYNENNEIILKAPIVRLDNYNISHRVKNYIIADKLGYMITNGLLKTSITKTMIKECGCVLFNRYSEDWVYIIKYLIAGKCKMIDNTHYNKLHTGKTSNVKTLNDLWNSTGITQENQFDKIVETIQDSIFNDDFCKNRLSKIQREKLSKTVTKSMKSLPFSKKFIKLCKFIKNYIKIGY